MNVVNDPAVAFALPSTELLSGPEGILKDLSHRGWAFLKPFSS